MRSIDSMRDTQKTKSKLPAYITQVCSRGKGNQGESLGVGGQESEDSVGRMVAEQVIGGCLN